MADLYEILQDTATRHIQAFESPNPFNPKQVYEFRNDDTPMRFHPGKAMPPPFDGTITRIEHEPALLMLAAIMSNVQVDIHEMIVDVKTRTGSSRITGVLDFIGVGDEWPEVKGYEINYVWITEMDESGRKIVRMEECIDARAAQPMLLRAAAWAEREKERKE